MHIRLNRKNFSIPRPNLAVSVAQLHLRRFLFAPTAHLQAPPVSARLVTGDGIRRQTHTQIQQQAPFRAVRRTFGGQGGTGKMAEGFKTVFTEGAAAPAGPYSQAIATPTTIYCSGQIPSTASGTILTTADSSIGEMTELCIKNLAAVLEAAGSSLSKVVKVNVFLTTMDSFAEMNGVYEKFFTHKPARSCVAVYQLPKGVPVEIECVALAQG